MATEKQVREKLDGILVPWVVRSLVALNLVREVKITSGKIDITLADAALAPEVQEWVKNKVVEAVKGLSGVKEVAVKFVEAKAKDVNEVKNVIAIMSGKGGVGKSVVASLVATVLARKGFTVGVLDADITGPSIPKMFGVDIHPMGSETGIMPVVSKNGVEVMSINLLLPHEEESVIWRGPIITGVIRQFWEDVLWGKLDYLIVDLPPGTADAPLTVLQTMPVTGVIVVFSPQELAAMVVKKAIHMIKTMKVPIIGVVENMSYLNIPGTKKRMDIFGKSKADEMVKAADAPLLATLPIDPELAKLCDAGEIERYDTEEVDRFAENLVDALSKVKKPA